MVVPLENKRDVLEGIGRTAKEGMNERIQHGFLQPFLIPSLSSKLLLEAPWDNFPQLESCPPETIIVFNHNVSQLIHAHPKPRCKPW